MRPPGSSWFRRLPLFWKLLLPFLALMLIMGATGTFLVVRDLSERAQALLDQDLSRRALEARAAIHDQELYLLESVNFASNLQGMARALRAGDEARATALLRSVLALKRDLDLLVALDRDGRPVARGRAATPATAWASAGFVREAVRSADGGRTSGLIQIGERTLFGVAGPVCARAARCAPAGITLAALSLESFATHARSRSGTAPSARAGVTLFDAENNMLASAGARATPPLGPLTPGLDLRRSDDDGADETATLFTPLSLQGKQVGTLAVTLAKTPAFAGVRGTGLRVAVIILAAMAGVVALGALLSRFILAQVRPLVATSRALGQGEFYARAPIVTDDELGELAERLNQMAEQLQASYETLESRVAQRTEEVQRLLAERTEFFAAMSHEFRTPLAIILSEADMLTDTTKPMTARFVRTTGHTIRVSSEQLLRVINEILDLARADAGRIDVELCDTRLDAVIKELRSTIEGLAKQSDLAATIDIARGLPPVVADPGRLREVILNLVDNAVKYTPAGGRITVAAVRRNGHVEVSVADTGIGIPHDVGDRLFEPFYRVKGTKPLRGQASTGLGLALTKRFVEAQGGEIDFTSRPGEGSTFTFTLTPADARKPADHLPA